MPSRKTATAACALIVLLGTVSALTGTMDYPGIVLWTTMSAWNLCTLSVGGSASAPVFLALTGARCLLGGILGLVATVGFASLASLPFNFDGLLCQACGAMLMFGAINIATGLGLRRQTKNSHA